MYGTEGTLMIFAAFAGHAVMCSLLLQPVHWHTKYKEVEVNSVGVLLQSIISVIAFCSILISL